ncbi:MULTISPECIES: restriction endonuclease subunit S [Aeromonas]|uniref:restriction endonuclease subunit S n=1 Tax=Aeromonas TaxID=642 RepID=UPI0029DB5019|nr:restriction endonuclease subunit S [Aeromonas caviae]MDX7648037.1 restriction endonuclease subunit S [Aeromonas caviae]
MSSNWDWIRLGDYCSKIGSGATPSGGKSSYLDFGPFCLIRSQNIYNDGFTPSGLAYISLEQAKKLESVSVEENDVLLNITGDSVARVCLALGQYLPARVNQHVAIIRPLEEKLDSRFLRYFLASPTQQDLMLGMAAAGATRNALTKVMIENFKVPCPPLEEQKQIADILALFDDRTALLRETNATLEAIAQALFKSWFVDFDPVHARARGEQPAGLAPEVADLFPDSFEESALGMIPKGWKLMPFGELLNHTIGGDWGDETPNDKNDTKVAIIRGTDMPDLQSGMIGRVPVRYTSQKKLATRKLQDGDLVLEVSGGSKDQPTGRSLYMTTGLLEQFDCPVEPASFCRLLRPISHEYGVLLSQHMTYIYADGKTWQYQNQSTGIANFQTTHFLETEVVAVPTDDVLKLFAETIRSMIDRSHQSQIAQLAALRDTLLPRLISGQLRLPDAEQQLKDLAV